MDIIQERNSNIESESTAALAASEVVNPERPRRAKTSLRLRYEAEALVIERKLGDLEGIRETLGLSQRKIAQLLLVDPSAWTRWTKGGDRVPPHIFRMLQWYLALEEKYPALDVNFWLNTVGQPHLRSEFTSPPTRFRNSKSVLSDKPFEDLEAQFEIRLRDRVDLATADLKVFIANKESKFRRALIVFSLVAAFLGLAIGFCAALSMR